MSTYNLFSTQPAGPLICFSLNNLSYLSRDNSICLLAWVKFIEPYHSSLTMSLSIERNT